MAAISFSIAHFRVYISQCMHVDRYEVYFRRSLVIFHGRLTVHRWICGIWWLGGATTRWHDTILRLDCFHYYFEAAHKHTHRRPILASRPAPREIIIIMSKVDHCGGTHMNYELHSSQNQPNARSITSENNCVHRYWNVDGDRAAVAIVTTVAAVAHAKCKHTSYKHTTQPTSKSNL